MLVLCHALIEILHLFLSDIVVELTRGLVV